MHGATIKVMVLASLSYEVASSFATA